MSYANKVAVVTGASSGIGRALAVALAARGGRVGAIARREPELRALAAEVHSRGGTLEVAVADVGDRASVGAAIRALAGKLGAVDLLIANAGVSEFSGAASMNVPAVETMMRVNFLGVVYAFEAVLEPMIARRGGHLVAMSSLAAYKGLPGSAGYCASKAAVNNYVEALRIELRAHRVAATTVCPGFIDTPMTKQNTEPMPFLMTAERAAEKILRALPRRPAVYDFPWPMRLLMRLAKWAPDRLIARKVMVNERGSIGVK